jgi:electron transfer flavoprotein alpha/beta subunit
VAFLLEQAKKSIFFVTHGGCHSSDYVEKVALSLGLEKLFLLTTRTADWYLPLFS